MAREAKSAELDAWVLATAPRAVAYARSLLHNSHQAEDIVQDCYCRLLQKVAVYDLPRDGLKLLMAAITNACINLKTRRKPFVHLTTGSSDEVDGIAEPADASIAPPEAIAMGNELQAAVHRALANLTPTQRAAIELKSLGYSQQEIAEILNVSPNNAGVLIHRARQALAGLLTPYLGEEKIT